MRSRSVLRVDPVWSSASALSEELGNLLAAQGYQVASSPTSGGALVLVPVDAINALFVFAAGDRVLNQVEVWARELDAPRQAEDEPGIFRYRVQNTSADEIAAIIGQLLSGQAATLGDPEGARDQREAGQAGRETSRQQTGAGTQGLVVDEIRNTLLFRGSAQDWQRLRPLIAEMDRPTPMVLIEVTIAEITLTDQRDLGVEGLARGSGAGIFRRPHQHHRRPRVGRFRAQRDLRKPQRCPLGAQRVSLQRAGQHPVAAAPAGQIRQSGEHRCRHRGPDHHQPGLDRRLRQPRRRRHSAGSQFSQHRGASQRHAHRARPRRGRPGDRTGGQRGAADRDFQYQQPVDLQSTDQHRAHRARRSERC